MSETILEKALHKIEALRNENGKTKKSKSRDSFQVPQAKTSAL
jgi:hypothetical protein